MPARAVRGGPLAAEGGNATLLPNDATLPSSAAAALSDGRRSFMRRPLEGEAGVTAGVAVEMSAFTAPAGMGRARMGSVTRWSPLGAITTGARVSAYVDPPGDRMPPPASAAAVAGDRSTADARRAARRTTLAVALPASRFTSACARANTAYCSISRPLLSLSRSAPYTASSYASLYAAVRASLSAMA
jgi:hypothetical protein